MQKSKEEEIQKKVRHFNKIPNSYQTHLSPAMLEAHKILQTPFGLGAYSPLRNFQDNEQLILGKVLSDHASYQHSQNHYGYTIFSLLYPEVIWLWKLIFSKRLLNSLL